MPIFHEKTFSKTASGLVIVLCFLIIYPVFQIGHKELRWDEGYYAAIASEMDILKPNTVAQGELIFSYPLYPWFVALLYKVPLDFLKYEFGLRLISILSIMALALIVWETASKAIDEEAGLVAAAALVSSLLVMEKGLEGYPEMLGIVFLFSAWMTWFNLGAVKGKWNSAWTISFFFCGLAFYTIGWSGIFFFAFPLIFMRRPLTIWSRLKKPGFGVGVIILASFIAFWGWPILTKQADMPFRNLSLNFTQNSDYFEQILLFPLQLVLRLMPWSLLAWPAFCPAYQPLDKNPVFSRFLKTIFISLFFIFWIRPDTDWRDISILAAPLAILVGVNYSILVRRHGDLFIKIIRRLLSAVTVLLFLILLFHLCMIFGLLTSSGSYLQGFLSQMDDFKIRQMLEKGTFAKIAIYAVAESIIMIIVLIYVLRKKINQMPVWAAILILTTGGTVCYWLFVAPAQAAVQDNRPFAQEIDKLLRDDGNEMPVIYKAPEIKGLNAPFLYVNCTVRKLKKSFSEIPASETTVFVVGPDYPASQDRTWENMTPKPIIYKKHSLYLWKGTLTKKDDATPPAINKDQTPE